MASTISIETPRLIIRSVTMADLKDLTRIHGGAALENLASKRVMEKIGMHYIGVHEEGGYAFTMERPHDQNPQTW